MFDRWFFLLSRLVDVLSLRQEGQPKGSVSDEFYRDQLEWMRNQLALERLDRKDERGEYKRAMDLLLVLKVGSPSGVGEGHREPVVDRVSDRVPVDMFEEVASPVEKVVGLFGGR